MALREQNLTEEQIAAIQYVRGRISNPTNWELFTTRVQVQPRPEIFFGEESDLSTLFDFSANRFGRREPQSSARGRIGDGPGCGRGADLLGHGGRGMEGRLRRAT